MRFVWSALMLVAAGVFPLVGEPSPEAVSGRLASSMRPSDVSPDLAPTTAAAEPELRDSGLSIRSIETHIGTDGAQDFVIVFDGPVPDARIGYFDDINHVDSSRVGYTTQEWTPERPTPLSTCGDQHFGFSPPAIVGQVDVLMPGDGSELRQSRTRSSGSDTPRRTGSRLRCVAHTTATCSSRSGRQRRTIPMTSGCTSTI
jgi:hypothetical protein